MKAGTRRSVRRTIECVGPLCSRPGIKRSMSASTETARRIGILVSRLRSSDAAFPVR